MTHRLFTPQIDRSPLRWPEGRGLAISFVLNIEEGAEHHISAGDSGNEGVHEVVNALHGVPDFCMETHFEYGARAGYPRIAQRFIDTGLPLTLNVCGRALGMTPWVARDAIAQHWELCGHGWRWESPAHFSAEHERADIERTCEAIRAHWGRAPAGWHCKSSASVHTRALLQEMGFAYDSNDYGGEVPRLEARRAGGPYVVLPYAFDTNDMRFYQQGGFVHAEDFARYTAAAVDGLLQEARHAPRLLTIGLHTRILGRPARIAALDQILAHIRRRQEETGAIWIATREAMAAHWRALHGHASSQE